MVLARERMGGRLCQDLVYERHPDTTDLSTIKELDVTHAGIKVIDLSPVVALDNLARWVWLKMCSLGAIIYFHVLYVQFEP